ncbi:MAG: xylulokinase [Christensenellaceae bacterium]
MKYLMGIDVGTSGVKCLVIDKAGTVIKSVTKTYPLNTPKPAWSEQDPADWWKGTKEALKELLADVDASKIEAIGLSGQMHGLVALDKDNQVIRNAILWNDQRTDEECAEIIENAGGIKGLVGYTNNNMLTGYTGGKILWLKKNEPENFAKISTFVMPKDYIRYCLTGELSTDVSEASGTGFFNVEKREWASDLVSKIGFDIVMFPKVVESDERTGEVTQKCAKETGLLKGIPVYAGGGDAVIQNTGMGIIKEGTLGVVMGTSGVVATAMNSFGKNAGGKLQFFCNNAADKYMVFGCQLSCAGSMEWFKNTFYDHAKQPFKEINEGAENSKIGANGVVFLPYLTGERCPYPNPDARGVFYGLSLLSNKGDMARAVMEGVVFGLYQMYELILKTNHKLKIKEVILSGGGANSALWKQIVADVFNLPVKILAGAAEGGAYGAALVAGVGAGIYENLEDAEKVHKVKEMVQPTAKNHEAYEKVMKIYEKLYFDLKDTFELSSK